MPPIDRICSHGSMFKSASVNEFLTVDISLSKTQLWVLFTASHQPLQGKPGLYSLINLHQAHAQAHVQAQAKSAKHKRVSVPNPHPLINTLRTHVFFVHRHAKLLPIYIFQHTEPFRSSARSVYLGRPFGPAAIYAPPSLTITT